MVWGGVARCGVHVCMIESTHTHACMHARMSHRDTPTRLASTTTQGSETPTVRPTVDLAGVSEGVKGRNGQVGGVMVSTTPSGAKVCEVSLLRSGCMAKYGLLNI